MTGGRWAVGLLGLAVVALFARFCIVILDEREQAFRTLLNEPEFEVLGIQINRPALTTPGIYVRIPGLHQLYRYERRRMRFDAESRELFTKDKELIEVDYFAVWQIEDPRRFFEANRTLVNATRRLDTVSYSNVREALGTHNLSDLLSGRRSEIMRRIAEQCDDELRPRGIRVRDLRIRRSDYPEANLARILDRMRSERQRFAKKARAEGDEVAREVRSGADRESQVIRSEATRESERLRGLGDARAAEIYGRAYSRDAEFYSFVKSLEAYRMSLDDSTMFVLTPRSRFLRHLFRDSGGSPSGATPESSGTGDLPTPRRAP